MNLEWHKCNLDDLSSFPTKHGKYFGIVSGRFIIICLEETGQFFENDDFECECYPRYWANIPKYNLPDEMLLDMIK